MSRRAKWRIRPRRLAFVFDDNRPPAWTGAVSRRLAQLVGWRGACYVRSRQRSGDGWLYTVYGPYLNENRAQEAAICWQCYGLDPDDEERWVIRINEWAKRLFAGEYDDELEQKWHRRLVE